MTHNYNRNMYVMVDNIMPICVDFNFSKLLQQSKVP